MTLLEQKLAAMGGYPRLDAAIVRRIGDALMTADDSALARINPRAFSTTHELDEAKVLDAFLVGAKVGLLDMQFHLVCPGCGGVESSTQTWNGLAKEATWCAVCDADVPVVLDDHVEVSFSPADAVRAVQVDHYADAQRYIQHFFSDAFERSPEMDALVQSLVRGFLLPRGESSASIPINEPAGERLRLISVDANACAFVNVVLDGPKQAVVEAVPAGLSPREVNVAPGGELVVRNLRAGPIGAMLALDRRTQARGIMHAHPSRFRPFLSAKQLLNNQRFRELFKVQSLDPSLRLRVRSLTLLFTDLKGSTALYDSTGDVTAYAVVQEHFDALMAAVRAHGGAVVKTMGDAVMASFSAPDDAVRAADDMLRAMEPVEARVRGLGYSTGLKVGIHEGTALAVSSDDRLDYFGQTVNIAARVQALADAGEIWLTDAVMKHDAVSSLVRSRAFRVEPRHVELKGVGGGTDVFRLQRA